MRNHGNVLIALFLAYTILFIIILGFFIPPGETGVPWGQEMALVSFVCYLLIFYKDKRFGPTNNPWALIAALIFGPPILATMITMTMLKDKIDWTNRGSYFM